MSESVRRVLFFYFASLVILSSCSYEGRIVRKEFTPMPFYASLGVRGLYRFDVRCRDGQVRRQVVSADVFADYRAGDYFTDQPRQLLSSPAPPAEGPPPKVTPPFKIMLALRPLERYGTHYATVPTAWIEPAALPSEDRVVGPGRTSTDER